MTLEDPTPPSSPSPDFWSPLREALKPLGVGLQRWQPVPGVTPSETAMQHAWFIELTKLYPRAEVRFEAFTLVLPCGTLWSPVFTVIQEPGRQMIGLYEVHGSRPQDDRSYTGFLKAQAAIPIWDFQYVRKIRQGWVLSPDRESSHSQPDPAPPVKNKSKATSA